MKFCYNVIERDGDKDLLYQLEYDIDCPYLCDSYCDLSHKYQLCIYADRAKILSLLPYNYKYCARYRQYEICEKIQQEHDSGNIGYTDLPNGIRLIDWRYDWLETELRRARQDEEMYDFRYRRNIIHIDDMQKFLYNHPNIRLMTPIKNTKYTYKPKYLYINQTPVKDFTTNIQYKKIKCMHCGKEVYSNTNYCFACLQYENFESK